MGLFSKKRKATTNKGQYPGPQECLDNMKRDLRQLEKDIKRSLDYMSDFNQRPHSKSPRHHKHEKEYAIHNPDDDDLVDPITPINLSKSVDTSGSTDEKFLAVLELDEYSPSDVKVSVKKGMVSVSGEQEESYEDQNGKRQYTYKSFSNSFTLPEDVDEKSLHYSIKLGNTLVFEAPRQISDSKPRSR
ncbi:outer dense fiber protein 1 [Discoglossus pictus]